MLLQYRGRRGQRREWRAKFVADVAREARVAFETLHELTDHLVEGLGQLLDFAVGAIHLETCREGAVGDQGGREGDLLERPHRSTRDPDPTTHTDDRREDGAENQGERE